GGAIRPWMVTVVKNNAGVAGSDVLTFGDVPATLPVSVTVMAHIEGGSFSLFVPTPTRANPDRGRCGLAELRRDTDNDGFPQDRSDTAAAFRPRDLVGQEVILASPSGTTWRSVKVVEVGFGASTADCFIRFTGTSAGLIANGAFADADRFSRLSSGREDLQQWIGGQVAFVRAREWRFEPKTTTQPGRLVERLTEAGATTERVLFEGVLDLQVAVGYDFDPFDGTLRETEDSRGDEWINRLPNDTHRLQLPTGLADREIDPDLLRMLDIGVVVALPRAERQNTVRAFDGEPQTGPEARIAGGRAYLRNLLLFL
ncbi:MAG TPA: hypothetical protein VGF99_17575, partial [Myxococcota bacterium]